MRHTVIIPHRDRTPYLLLCLRTLLQAAEGYDVQIIVVDDSLGDVPMLAGVRYIKCLHPPDVFNKSKLLNIGLDHATGDLLTTLDADAIVGRMFFAAGQRVDWRHTHRLCYRVRYLPRYLTDKLLRGDIDVENARRQWDYCRVGYEAYGKPTANRFTPLAEPWGNSQGTWHRDRLGGLRYDERYEGRGYEDLDLLKRYAATHPDYRGEIVTDCDHAMLHMEHDYEPSWRSPEMTRRNLRIFQGHPQ